MALVPDQKFSTFQNGGTPIAGDIVVGLRGGINTRFNWSFPTAVDSLTGTANQVLVDGTTGTPVTGDVTLSTPQDIGTSSSPTFSTLTATTAVKTPLMLDSNGLTVLAFATIASAENYLTIFNDSTGAPPNVVATGSDTDIGINFTAKGTGGLTFVSLASSAPVNFVTGASAGVTSFNFSNTTTRNVTWQDASGTVAYLGDIPAGGMTWTTATISGATSVFNGYVSNSGSTLTFTLPAVASVGAVIAIEGLGAGGWILTANTGQTIKIGSGTTTSAGSLASSVASDNVYVTCIVANTTWRVRTTNSAGLIIS